MFDRERLEWLNGQWIRRLSADDLVERLRPFVEAELAAGRIDRMPSDDELRALLPVIHERLPTLGAIGDLAGFLWVDDVSRSMPRCLVPKRWDVATTREGLGAARDDDRRGRRGRLRGRRAGAAAAGARGGPRLEGRRPVHGHPRRRDRPDRDAAAVRHARRPWARPGPRPAGPCIGGPREVTRDEVQAWLEPAGEASTRDEPGTWEAQYEPFSVDGDRAVAVGWSRYYTDLSKSTIQNLWDNVYLLEFGVDGRCSSFTEYFVERPKDRFQA